MHVEPAPSARHGRHRAVGRDAPQRLHRREAGRVDGRAPGGNPERAARRRRRRSRSRRCPPAARPRPLSGSTWSRSVPRPVTQSDPASSAIRSGASPGSVVTRVGRFVRVSSRTSPRSRWFTTHAVVPVEDEIGRPVADLDAGRDAALSQVRSGARLRRESSTTHTDPAPIQMLYGAWASSEIRLTHPTRARSDACERAERRRAPRRSRSRSPRRSPARRGGRSARPSPSSWRP